MVRIVVVAHRRCVECFAIRQIGYEAQADLISPRSYLYGQCRQPDLQQKPRLR